MAVDKLGTKRSCPNCDGKFYDLNKNPMLCPMCKTEFKLEDIIKKRGESKVSIQDIEADDSENDIIMDSSLMDSDDIVEDTSDLGSDDDDMSDVIDNIEREDKDDNN